IIRRHLSRRGLISAWYDPWQGWTEQEASRVSALAEHLTARRHDRTTPRSLPCVYTRPLSAGAKRRPWRRPQPPHDPVPGVDRIYHLIDLEHRSDIDRLSIFIEFCDHIFEEFVAFDRVLDRFHLLAEAEPHRAFESHATKFAGRPGNREVLRMKSTARHGLRTESIA